MATKLTYKEQLLHPNWQRKRLEVLEAAGFACEECEATERTLHAHHKRYIKGRMVWEYENSDLACLCSACHKKAHENKELWEAEFSRMEPWDIAIAHALLVGFRGGLVESEGIPAKYADSVLIESPDSSKAYWVGQIASRMCSDMTEEEVSQVYYAFVSGDLGRMVEVIRQEADRRGAEVLQSAPKQPSHDNDPV